MPVLTPARRKRIALAVMPLLCVAATGSFCRTANEGPRPEETAAANRVAEYDAAGKGFVLAGGTIDEDLPIEKRLFEKVRIEIGPPGTAGTMVWTPVKIDSQSTPYDISTGDRHETGTSGLTLDGDYDWDTGRLQGVVGIVTRGKWTRKVTGGTRECDYEEIFKGRFDVKFPQAGMPPPGTKLKLSMTGKKERTETLKWSGQEKTDEFEQDFAYDPDFTVSIP